MVYFWSFRWLILQFIFSLFNIHYVKTAWPLSNFSSIQFLGLFPDASNTSEPTTLSVHSRAMFKAAIMLSRQYNITIQGQYIGWNAAQTDGNVMDAFSSTCLAVSTSNVMGIVGPAFSREAHTIADFANRVGIPVISYSATDPDLSDRNAYPAFYRTVPSDNAAAVAIAELFSRFNWTSCIVIYQNDAFGSGGAKVISEVFNNNGLVVSSTIIFDIATLRIRGNLKTYLASSSTRIILLWADPIYTPLILQNAIDSDVVGPQFTWILSSSVPLGSFNQTFNDKLIGMFIIEPVIGSVVNAPINITLLNTAYSIWQQYEPESFPGPTNVNYYAYFAFDATWMLIQSLQEFCPTSMNSSTQCISFIGSPYCFDRRLSNSNSLFDQITNTIFLGVSGPIQFSANTTDRTNGTYYLAQNVQPSGNGINYVSVLEWSQSNEWEVSTESVIIWPGNTLIPPIDHAILSGVTLRIGVIESSRFTMVQDVIDTNGKNKTELTGFIPDLINILQSQMGFTPQIILTPLNQTYSGLIQAVKNNIYDIVIADVTVTSARRQIVDFTDSIFDNSLRIVMRKTEPTSVDLFSYLQPFSLKLWLVLLITSIYAATLMCLSERQANEALQKRSIISSGAMCMWYTTGAIFGYGADFYAKTAPGRFLTVGLYILSLVLVATYTANLTSDLTISKSKDIITGIDDIKNGKLSFNRIGIIVDSAIEDFYLREISGGSRNFYPLKNQEDLYESLLNGLIDAALSDIGVAEYDTNNIFCNLTLVGADFDKSSFGIVIPKDWLYTQDLDVTILSLTESGVLDDLKLKWFQTKSCPVSSDTSTAMDIESMAGLFMTFAVISAVTLLSVIWKKRFILKDYLFTLIFRKTVTIQHALPLA
ncbi:unnamed protein product [Adineta steineri]|uniref:Ionotropic glutamate receptor C-terminal domain-containing protein n=1 Tax=Adineta steineri TaxID=433720 RepID=A0A815JFS5_9BILA|nr:unnamed protein product [Adineta steineri]